MEIHKICSFFGHRHIEISEDLRIKLKTLLEMLIMEHNYTTFYFGGFGEFDDLCWQIITELKQKYWFIKRVYVCEDFKFVDRPHKRPAWLKESDYEEFIYLDMDYKGFYKRIYFRNCEIIKQSDCVIFYVERFENSNAYKALKFAIIKRVKCINIANYI